ncbi:MAG: cyclic nucleotide-binding domain-containing protein [Deltaproteobacteria bacterium]|nr:cyclic nucleotide-binding domain-containing protein [Deltaproteobacteria bacterium]
MSERDNLSRTEQGLALEIAAEAVDALVHYTAALTEEPDEFDALAGAGRALAKLGEKDTAIAALSTTIDRFAQRGDLLAAIAALRALAELDEGTAEPSKARLAELYGRESQRVDRSRMRVVPPALPKAAPQPIAKQDPRAARAAAIEVCERICASTKKPADADSKKLPFHPLFSDLQATDLAALIPLTSIAYAATGTRLIEQGDSDSAFFVLVRGEVGVEQRDGQGQVTQVARLRDGAFFGEMALLTRTPRVASVVALRPSIALRLDRAAVESLAKKSASVGRVLADYTRQRLLKNVMLTAPLFRRLEDPARRQALIDLFSSNVFADGDVIVRQSEHVDGLHVLLSGEATVVAEGDVEVVLATLGPGDVFGEISLIQRSPATATVRAVGKSVILRLSREQFNQRVDQYPEVLAHLYALANQRQQANDEALEEETVNLSAEDLLL